VRERGVVGVDDMYAKSNRWILTAVANRREVDGIMTVNLAGSGKFYKFKFKTLLSFFFKIYEI
jgi:hypothetical protein